MRGTPESEKNGVDRIGYLLERKKRGRILYSNFQAMSNVGISPYMPVKSIRPELGDFEHIASTALRIFSSLYLSPIFAYEFYKLGKIIGYCTVDGALKTLKIKSLVNTLAKTGLLSTVFQNKRVHAALRTGWQKDGGGLIDLMGLGKEEKSVKYSMRENSCAIIKTLTDRYQYECQTKPCSGMEIGVLCGQAEALFGGLWDGTETKCTAKGDSHCEMELYLHEEEIQPRISILTKSEYDRILDMSIEFAVSKEKNTERREVGDFLSISISQSLNYLLLSTSKGHVVLSRWAGRKVGERIIKRIGVNNLFDALDYLKDLFRDLKMGILEYETNPTFISVKMRESVYSAGVKNINMKLCVFMAGIVEGAFIEATSVRWTVTETKCTANGDPQCEFECKTEDPRVLEKLLLG
jgi:predicted hydrocarbon binding protein